MIEMNPPIIINEWERKGLSLQAILLSMVIVQVPLMAG